ncbi:PAS domain-containing protein, partial [candidate division GN15 bacterium]|nr:PAS domain-containing protein [candidate division GN15 bacterium]
RMASQLQERIRTIVEQRNEQNAVLSSMIEGVVAIDSRERVINLNKAAAAMFEIDQEWARNRSIQEVMRNVDLHGFASRALNSLEPIEAEITLPGNEERYLHVHGTVLRDASGERTGGVIVMNDITRLKRLENIRRDFVANVSHELKTPITSIRGFVETLLDGAMNQPHDAWRFLKIIIKQTNRLNAIVEDLLSLSRIEKETESREIELSRYELFPILTGAVQSCEARASARKIRVTLACDRDITATVNARYLEQAVINLIDNAIKYSESNSEVRVSAEVDNGGVAVRVSDEGCGIAPEHLSRLFERFYRVDKARSREVGGTGLGLAIVKHIALAHRGQVTVDSTPGEGSTFTIHLPGN